MLLIDSPLPGASMAPTHLFLYKRERPTVSQMFSLKTLCTRGEEIGDWRGAKRVRRDIMSRRLGFFPLRIHPKTSPRFEIRNSPPKIIRSLSVTSNSSRLLLLPGARDDGEDRRQVGKKTLTPTSITDTTAACGLA